MSRAVLFDTETTGLEPHLGHRVIEVAALELMNDLPTGRHFHALIHPERDIPEDATRIHGFTLADLAGKPRFAEIVDELLEFFGDAKLIAHNAPFDFAFLDAEFAPHRPTGVVGCAHDRHAGVGQDAVPRDAEQPRCTVPAVRDRSQRAHDAQRAAGLQAVG